MGCVLIKLGSYSYITHGAGKLLLTAGRVLFFLLLLPLRDVEVVSGGQCLSSCGGRDAGEQGAISQMSTANSYHCCALLKGGGYRTESGMCIPCRDESTLLLPYTESDERWVFTGGSGDDCGVGYSGACSEFAKCQMMNDGSMRCVCLPGFSGNGLECSDVNECEEGSDNCDRRLYLKRPTTATRCLEQSTKKSRVSKTSTDRGAKTATTKRSLPTRKLSSRFSAKDRLTSTQHSTPTTREIPTRQYTSMKTRETSVMKSQRNKCLTILTPRETRKPELTKIRDYTRRFPEARSRGICINTLGGFTCSCREGFTLNGTTCIDENECVNGTRCAQNAVCKNLIGSYRCRCPRGYVGDGVECCISHTQLNLLYKEVRVRSSRLRKKMRKGMRSGKTDKEGRTTTHKSKSSFSSKQSLESSSTNTILEASQSRRFSSTSVSTTHISSSTTHTSSFTTYTTSSAKSLRSQAITLTTGCGNYLHRRGRRGRQHVP